MSASLTKMLKMLQSENIRTIDSSMDESAKVSSFAENFDQNSYDNCHSFLENIENSAIEFSEQEKKVIIKAGIGLMTSSAALALTLSGSFTAIPALLGLFLVALSQSKSSSSNSEFSQKSMEANIPPVSSQDIHCTTSTPPTLDKVEDIHISTTTTTPRETIEKGVNSNKKQSELINEIQQLITSLNKANLTESDKLILKGVIKSCSSVLAVSLSMAAFNLSPTLSIPIIFSVIDNVLDQVKTQTAPEPSELDLVNMEMMSYGYYY